jgi:hypothetical protein
VELPPKSKHALKAVKSLPCSWVCARRWRRSTECPSKCLISSTLLLKLWLELTIKSNYRSVLKNGLALRFIRDYLMRTLSPSSPSGWLDRLSKLKSVLSLLSPKSLQSSALAIE